MSKQGKEEGKNPWKSFRLVESDGKLNKKLNRLAKLGKQSIKGSRAIYKKLQELEENLVDRFDRDEMAEALAATKQRLSGLEQELNEVKEEVLRKEESKNLNKEILQEIRTEIEQFSTEKEYTRRKKAIEKNIEQLEDLRTLQDQNPSQDFWEPLISRAKGVLEHQGVEILDEVPGEFAPATQEAIEVRETEEEDRDGKIAEVFRYGYRYLDGTLIKPVKVAVCKYREEPEEVNEK
ncbi:nucleotide exchange factor GrpE [Candidatus Bipolaricaulota bacterium]|nr:nucleotide exchange factor GrpE [Candidatus Bipolaricaulota bacterium]